jgi:NADPH:quinone reductase
VKQVIWSALRLELVNAPTPQPGPGQLLVEVAAAGVGLVDLLMCQAAGAAAFVPGIEVAGTVTDTGGGVLKSLIGTRIFARVIHGGYAENVLVEAAESVLLPDTVDCVTAVGVGVNTLVAHFALTNAMTAAGQRVLVRGASGGIGVMAAKLALSLGATVAASSRGRYEERLGALGIQEVVDTNSRGTDDFDVIIDLVAGQEVPKFIDRLKPNGRYVIAGIAGGLPPSDFGNALLTGFRRSLSVSTLSLDTVSPLAIRQAAEHLFAKAARAELSAVIDRELPLAEAAQAHALLTGGDVFGKLVLLP